MAVVDLKSLCLFSTIRKKLHKPLDVNPLKPNSRVNAFPLLLPGIYQMRPRPNGPICVRHIFYAPTETPARIANPRRAIFASAVLAWQNLTADQKLEYHKKAYGKHMSGYNLFMKQYLLTN